MMGGEERSSKRERWGWDPPGNGSLETRQPSLPLHHESWGT